MINGFHFIFGGRFYFLFIYLFKKQQQHNSGFGEVHKFLVHSEFLVLLVLKRKVFPRSL